MKTLTKICFVIFLMLVLVWCFILSQQHTARLQAEVNEKARIEEKREEAIQVANIKYKAAMQANRQLEQMAREEIELVKLQLEMLRAEIEKHDAIEEAYLKYQVESNRK